MSLYSIGLFMFGASIGCLIGAFIGHLAGYQRGRDDYIAEIMRRLRQQKENAQ